MQFEQSGGLALCVLLVISNQVSANNRVSTCEQQAYRPKTLALAKVVEGVDRLRQQGHLNEAYDKLLPWLQSHGEDPRILRAMAKLYVDSGDHARARAIYRQIGNTPASALRLANHHQERYTAEPRFSYTPYRSQKEYSVESEAVSRKPVQKYRLRPISTHSFQAKRQNKEGYFTYPKAGVTSLARSSVDNRYPYEPYQGVSASETLAEGEVAEPEWVESARADLQDLEAQITTLMVGGIAVRSRSGGSDLEDLTDIEVPINIQAGLDYEHKLGVQIRPVFLSTEEFSMTSREGQTFGSLPLTAASLGTDSIDQNEEGVALAVYYQADELTVDAGVTPLGFPEESIVGGIDWRPQINETVQLQVDAERRAMKNSLLTYAGTVDPRTGDTWGGVTQSGVRIGFAHNDDQHGVYAGAGYYFLQGSGVKDNTLLDVNGGAYWQVHRGNDYHVTLGTHLMYQNYDHNLRHFTLGHGGYFSPRDYVSVGLPAELVGHSGNFSYRLKGLIGAQYFEEDEADVFPDNPNLQRQLEVLSQTEAGLQTTFDGNKDTGVLYSVGGEFEYSLTQHLALGGWVRSNNANDFNEHSVLAYMRYSFAPQGEVSVVNRPALNGPFSEIWY